MTDRQLILDAVLDMPETASLAQILDELKLLQSVAQGMADTKAGRVTSQDIVVKQMGAWISRQEPEI